MIKQSNNKYANYNVPPTAFQSIRTIDNKNHQLEEYSIEDS